MLYNIQDDYLGKLMMQFIEANGIKNVDIHSREFLSEFLDWIRERKTTSDTYIRLIEDIGLLDKVNDRFAVEVGKGKYDTTTRFLDTTLLTPYSLGMDKNRTIVGNLRIYDGVSNLFTLSKEGLIKIKNISSSFTTYMTQNPYGASNIQGWDELANSGEANIIVGVYGSVRDRDFKTKTKMIESFRDSVENGKIESTTFRDDYCCLVYTKPKVKVKVK